MYCIYIHYIIQLHSVSIPSDCRALLIIQLIHEINKDQVDQDQQRDQFSIDEAGNQSSGSESIHFADLKSC